MNRHPISLAIRLGLIVGLLGPAVAAGQAGIDWQSGRPLTWDDFTGRVARGAEAEQVAMTAASLGWTYRYALESSEAGCSYRITEIRATAVFDPARSWVRPGHRTADVLAHEQGHFDITELHKLKLEEASRALVGHSGSCGVGRARRAAARVEDEIARLIGPVYEDVWQDLADAQASYDIETGHGTRESAQQRWLATIAEGLRGAGWLALESVTSAR